MNSFMIYDISFLVLFSIAVIWFLIAKKKLLGREGPIFLYRTQVGVKIIDKIAKKNKKLLSGLAYVIVATGYVLMATMMWMLIRLIPFFADPVNVKLIKIPPLMPLIPYLPSIFKIEWLPPFYFTYWIVIIALVAIVHEGFHGIYSRLHNIKVKSTGFGFLGPILTFFVEPDEKKIQKTKIFPQLSILGAGVFANVLTAIFFFFIMWGFFSISYVPAGAMFNSYSYTGIDITTLNEAEIINETVALDGLTLNKIILDGKEYFIWEEYVNTYQDYESGTILAYHNYDALKQQLRGAVIQINEAQIRSHSDVRQEIDKYLPGETVKIITKDKEEILEYNLLLSEDYNQPNRTVIGIGVLIPSTSGVRGFFYKMLNSFRDQTVLYEPKSGSQLTEFVYFLLWWLVLINIGVALFNILPLGITDGGRYWYLTVLAITKSKKIAEVSFKLVTAAILGIFVLLMVFWFIGIR